MKIEKINFEIFLDQGMQLRIKPYKLDIMINF